MEKVGKRLLSTSLLTLMLVLVLGLMTPRASAWWISAGTYESDNWVVRVNNEVAGISITLEGYVGEDRDTLTQVIFPATFRGIAFRDAGDTEYGTRLGNSACNWPNATSFVFPAHVEGYRSMNVVNNPKLKTLILPDGLTAFVRSSVADCPELESIYLPPTIANVWYASLDGNPFSNCGALKDLYFYGEKPTNYDKLLIAEGQLNAYLKVHYLEQFADSWAGTYNAGPFRAKGDLALYGVAGENYAVRVVDAATGAPVSGASVEAKYQQSMQDKTYTTGANGVVELPGPYEHIFVTASGYSSNASGNKGPMNLIYLTPNSAGDLLSELKLSLDGGGGIDILHIGSDWVVTRGMQKSFTFQAAALDTVSRLELRQGYGDLVGEFTKETDEDGRTVWTLTVEEKAFLTDFPLYIEGYFTNGNAPVYENVRVRFKAMKIPARIELGGSQSILIPEASPLMGATTLYASFGDLTVATAGDMDQGAWRILIGRNVSTDDLVDRFTMVKSLIDTSFADDMNETRDNAEEAVTNIKEALAIISGEAKPTPKKLLESMGDPDVDLDVEWSLGGYLEGDYANDVLTGYIFFSIEAEGTIEVGAPYPIYGYFSVVGRAEADGTLRLEMDTGDVHFFINLGGEFDVKLGAGVGYDIAKVGLYGEGVLGAAGRLTTEKDPDTQESLSGFQEVYLKGEFGAEGTFLWYEADIPLLTGKLQLWPEFGVVDEEEMAAYLSLQAALTSLSEEENLYHAMDRDYLNGEGAERAALSRAAGASIGNVSGYRGFYDPDPQVIPIETEEGFKGALMVYVDDAGASARPEGNDRTALYYSAYNGNWEKSQMLETDDGTADFAPSVCAGGDGAYVVWQDATQTLKDVEATQAGQYFDLSVAKISWNWNNSYWETVVEQMPAVTTGNTAYENMPQIAVLEDGTVAVAWVGSSAGDMFGMKGIQTIKLSTFDASNSQWSVPREIGTVDGGVAALALGSLDGQNFSAAWLTDEDRTGTTNDRSLVLWTDGATATTLGAMEVRPQAPDFVKLPDGAALTWYEGKSGKVMKYAANSGSAELGDFTLSSAPTSITSSSGGDIAVVTSETADSRADVSLTLYDNNIGTWGQAPWLTEAEKDDYYRTPKATYLPNGTLCITAAKVRVNSLTVNVSDLKKPGTSGDSMTVNKSVKLVNLNYEQVKPQFVITGLFLDPEEPDDGTNLNLVAAVTNTGAVAGGPTIQLRGDALKASRIVQGGSIPSGDAGRVNISVPKTDFQELGGEVLASLQGTSSNSDPCVRIGADLVTTARSFDAGGRRSIAIAVENVGVVKAAAGKLVISDEADGTPIAYLELPEIPAGQSVKIVCELEDGEAIFHGGDTARLKVTASTDTVQTYLYNDVDSVYFTRFTQSDLIEVNWTAVDDAAKTEITYGQTNAQVFDPLPETGTTTGTVALEGRFSVNDPEAVPAAGNERSVTVIFTVTTEGEHKGKTFTKEYRFKVNKAPLTDLVPAVTGTPQVGGTLTASLTGVTDPDSQVTWQWYTVSTDGTQIAIQGATSASYSITEAQAGASMTVQATAKEINYTGSSRTSDLVTVAKLPLTGTLSISETNTTGEPGMIDEGDTLTAVLTELSPAGAQSGGTFQWYRDDSPIGGAVTAACTVTEADTAAKLKVIYTPDQSKYSGTAQISVSVGKWTLTGSVTLTLADETLTAAVTLGDVPNDAYKLVWLRDGVEFTNPGLRYSLTAADKGHTFIVKAVALKSGAYTGEMASKAVTVPADSPVPPAPSSGGGSSNMTYYTITASAREGGTIAPDGKVSVRRDQDKTFTITAAEGYEVADVLVDSKSVGAVSEYTFEKVTQAHTIEASFQKVDDVAGCLRDETYLAHHFTDLDLTAWYHDGIHFCVERELMSGYDNGKFGPDKNLSRAMLAQILYSQAGKPGVSGDSSFTDVASDIWYTKAVAWAAAQGIVSGYGDGRFGPDDNITREQLAVILWRSAGSPASIGTLNRFTDGNETSTWAMDALCWAVERGIVSGKGNGILDPAGQATRAEAAVMLMRYVRAAEK